MTRKRSNVKALALAVTCAILAGGYSGLNPVYAADKLYKDTTNPSTVTVTTDTSKEEITQITIGGVTLGGANGRIDAGLARFTSNVTVLGAFRTNNIIGGQLDASGNLINSDVTINGATFKTGGIITAATGSKIGGITINGNHLKDSTSNEVDIEHLANAVKNTQKITYNETDEYTKIDGKVRVGNVEIDGQKLSVANTSGNSSSITIEEMTDTRDRTQGVAKFTGTDNGTSIEDKLKVYTDGRVTAGDITIDGSTLKDNNSNEVTISQLAADSTNISGITRDATNNNTTIENKVKIKNDGSVTGVTSLNGKVAFENDGIYINKDADKNQIKIDTDGKVIIGKASSTYDEDGFYAGGHDFTGAKAAIGSDGSLKASGASGSLNVRDVTTSSTMIYTKAADGTNTIWMDPATGNISTNGTLQVGGGVDGTTAKVTIDGVTGSVRVGKDGSEMFGVDGETGNIATKGSLSVAGTSTFTGETTFTGGVKTNTINEATDGSGVTVDGVVLKDNAVTASAGYTVDTNNTWTRNNLTVGDGTNKVSIAGGNVTATGALKGQTLGIGTNNTEFTVDADGAVSAVGGKVKIDSTGKATFGENANDQTFIEGKKVTTGYIETTDNTQKSVIGGVEFQNGVISATTINATDYNVDNLTVKQKLQVGTTGNTTLIDGTLQLGSDEDKKLTADKLDNLNKTIKAGKVIDATSATIGGVSISGNNVTTTDGTIQGKTISDGAGAILNNNTVTAGTGIIGGMTLSGNKITGVTKIEANEFYADANNVLNTSGIKASQGTIGNVTIQDHNITTTGTVNAGTLKTGDSQLTNGQLIIDAKNKWTSTGVEAENIKADTATIGTNTKIDSTGITTNQVKIGDMTITDGNIADTNGVTINGVELKGNAVTASSGFTVDANNKLDSTGLTAKAGTFADSVTVGSSANSQTKVEHGKITVTGTDGRSSADGKVTTIDGGIITTDTLNVQRIELGEKLVDSTTGATITDSTIYLNKDGSFGAAKGAFQIDADGQVTNNIDVTGADASETIFSTSKTGINAKYRKGTGAETSGLTIEDNHAALNASGGATLDLKDKTAKLGIGTDSLTTYTEDTIESKVGDKASRTIKADTVEDKVDSASRTLKADSIVDSVAGKTITTDTDGTKFAINGSTDNTLINGSTITSTKGSATGVLDGSTLTLTNGAKSTVLEAGKATYTGKAGNSSKHGTTTTIEGGVITTDTLKVERIELGENLIDTDGNATTPTFGANLSMDKQGNFMAANERFTIQGADKTNAGAMNNIVGDKIYSGKYTQLNTDTDSAKMEHKDADGNVSTVSVGTNNAKMSTGDNASVSTSDGKVEIKGGTQTVTTTSDGTVFENTGHNTPFGGGSETKTTINGNEITTGKITTDQLVIKGNGQGSAGGTTSGGSIALAGDGSLKSDINDGTNHTTFETTKTGTTTTVNDGTYNATSTVTAKSIGSVITGGTVDISQTLDAENGKITNAVGATSTELSNDGFAVKQNGYTDVNIAKGDVSVTNKQTGKQVNLSDLGSLGDLNEEITSREEYTSNKTAVGAINAEAGIRREEVARLDGRINDVNDRVNKVGAMAAAIASLKSIGYDPQAPSEFSIGLGQYKGETGVAMGFFHYPNKNFMINVSLSTAGGETMGGIGATWRFGHKSPQKLLEEQRAEQAKKELAAAEKYQAAAKLAKEAQERAEYAAKLARQAQVSADNAKAAADATQAKHF